MPKAPYSATRADREDTKRHRRAGQDEIARQLREHDEDVAADVAELEDVLGRTDDEFEDEFDFGYMMTPAEEAEMKTEEARRLRLLHGYRPSGDMYDDEDAFWRAVNELELLTPYERAIAEATAQAIRHLNTFTLPGESVFRHLAAEYGFQTNPVYTS